MRILVMGAGAIGCSVGGPAFEAGHDVLLVDQWPANVEAIRERGLRLSGTVKERTIQVPALHIHEAQVLREPFDALFVAVKSYDTVWATAFGLRFLREPDGVAVSFQNGLNDPLVAGVAGESRTLGCVITIGAELVEPGHVVRTDSVSGQGSARWTVGELDGSETERARRIVEVCSAAGPAKLTTNLAGQRWSKLTANCMLNSVSGLSGLATGDVLADGRTRPVAIAVAAEVIRVARAAGHEVEPVATIDPARFVDASEGRGYDTLSADVEALGKQVGSTGRTSMLQDVLRNRRVEIEALNGAVVREGARLGVPTPVNAALVEEFAERQTGFRPDPEHLRRIGELVGSLTPA